MLPKPTGKDRDSSLRIDKAPGILSTRIPQRRLHYVGAKAAARQCFQTQAEPDPGTLAHRASDGGIDRLELLGSIRGGGRGGKA